MPSAIAVTAMLMVIHSGPSSDRRYRCRMSCQPRCPHSSRCPQPSRTSWRALADGEDWMLGELTLGTVPAAAPGAVGASRPVGPSVPVGTGVPVVAFTAASAGDLTGLEVVADPTGHGIRVRRRPAIAGRRATRRAVLRVDCREDDAGPGAGDVDRPALEGRDAAGLP